MKVLTTALTGHCHTERTEPLAVMVGGGRVHASAARARRGCVWLEVAVLSESSAAAAAESVAVQEGRAEGGVDAPRSAAPAAEGRVEGGVRDRRAQPLRLAWLASRLSMGWSSSLRSCTRPQRA